MREPIWPPARSEALAVPATGISILADLVAAEGPQRVGASTCNGDELNLVDVVVRRLVTNVEESVLGPTPPAR